MDYLEKLKAVMFSPSKFFAGIAKESDIMPALKFAVITTLILSVILGIFLTAAFTFFASSLAIIPGLGQLLAIAAMSGGILILPIVIIFMLIIMVFGLFINSAVLHIFAKLLGGSGNFSSSFKAVSYSIAPLILAWIPLIGFIAAIWEIVLLTIGLSKLHRTNIIRAILMWAIPVIVIYAILALPFVF